MDDYRKLYYGYFGKSFVFCVVLYSSRIGVDTILNGSNGPFGSMQWPFGILYKCISNDFGAIFDAFTHIQFLTPKIWPQLNLHVLGCCVKYQIPHKLIMP